MAKIATKMKPRKAAKKAKPVKKTVKKAVKKAPVLEAIKTDSNGDPLGAGIGPIGGSEIDTSKGAVSIKAKKTGAEASNKKKNYSVVMRGGVPTKVEDDGDDA